jgi:hypothetical protein
MPEAEIIRTTPAPGNDPHHSLPDFVQVTGHNNSTVVNRITALWALSETALGGILHAMHIPFTGLFIGGSAVLFITFLACFSDKRNTILRSTLLVLIVKFLGSPHSPLNAYFAVAFQGIAGEYLFRLIKSRRLSALTLGIFSLMQSAFQKLIVLTIVFGNGFWSSLDVFGRFVVKQFAFPGIDESHFRLSYILITAYGLTHLVAGVLIGFLAPLLVNRVRSECIAAGNFSLPLNSSVREFASTKHRHGKRLSGILLLMVFLIVFIGSYLLPDFEISAGVTVVVMVIRSLLIMTIWRLLLAPFLFRKFQQYLKKERLVYTNEITQIVSVLPAIRQLAILCWTSSSQQPWFRRVPYFLQLFFVRALYYEMTSSFADR